MFLSRFPINTARRGAHKLLGSPQAMHAAVLAAFPPSDSTRAGRVLWRVDRTGPQSHLYVVSPTRPDFTHLVEQAGWPTGDDPWQTRPYDSFLTALANTQRWNFRLRANPVKQARDIHARVAHVTAAQQRDWLLTRTHKLGFTVAEGAEDLPAVTVSERERRVFRRADSTVTLATAQFDGVLIITDAAALRTTLCSGIGRGKAYGCGLLTLAHA